MTVDSCSVDSMNFWGLSNSFAGIGDSPVDMADDRPVVGVKIGFMDRYCRAESVSESYAGRQIGCERLLSLRSKSVVSLNRTELDRCDVYSFNDFFDSVLNDTLFEHTDVLICFCG